MTVRYELRSNTPYNTIAMLKQYLSRVGNAHQNLNIVGNAHPTYMFKNQIVILYFLI